MLIFFDESQPAPEYDNETLKSCASANRRFVCDGLDFPKRDDFRSVN